MNNIDRLKLNLKPMLNLKNILLFTFTCVIAYILFIEDSFSWTFPNSTESYKFGLGLGLVILMLFAPIIVDSLFEKGNRRTS